MRKLIIAAAFCVLASLVFAGVSSAGYSVSPNGQAIPVTLSPSGYIASPQTIDFTVYLDNLDRDPYIWISDSPQITSFGGAAGSLVGSCTPSELLAIGQGRYVCRETTILMRPGRTYYWWMAFRRLDTANYFGQQRVSGPFTFTLVDQTPLPPPPPDYGDTDTGGTETTSSRTVESAPLLPSRNAYRGTSIKQQRLSTLVYETMKQLGHPKTLAVACWSEDDWVSVLGAEGEAPSDSHTTTMGFWMQRQPRWLHVSPQTCENLQALLDGSPPTGRTAGALSTVLHETLHAQGIKNEAQANCYAVQLTDIAARKLGWSATRSRNLSRLAVNYVRRTAPADYWNYANCSDGGRWDLLTSTRNLG